MLHHSSAAPQALMQPQTFNIQDLELSNDLPPPGGVVPMDPHKQFNFNQPDNRSFPLCHRPF